MLDAVSRATGREQSFGDLDDADRVGDVVLAEADFLDFEIFSQVSGPKHPRL